MSCYEEQFDRNTYEEKRLETNSVGCQWEATVRFCWGFLFHRRRKTKNLIDNEIYVTAETLFASFKTFCDSAILARTVISKHFAIQARNSLRFWQGEEIDKR